MGKKVVQESKSGASVKSGVKVSSGTTKPHLGKRKASLAKAIISNDYSSGIFKITTFSIILFFFDNFLPDFNIAIIENFLCVSFIIFSIVFCILVKIEKYKIRVIFI